jgi:hypothetical protein
VSHTLALIIESLVAILLMITIGYCISLNKRLIRLKADEHALKATISELITATEIAERAIAGLKMTVRECDQNLGERLRSAERFCADIDFQVASGNGVIERLALIVSAARPAMGLPPAPVAAPVPAADPRAMVAAAQAIADRARSRLTGRAA